MKSRPCWWLVLALLLLPIGSSATAAPAAAAALHARYSALQAQLAHNPFGRPLVLDSSDRDGRSAGDVYGVLAYPFATLRPALDGAADWCHVLDLHLNVKYCRASGADGSERLTVYAGRKYYQLLSDAYRLDYSYRVAAEGPGYLRIELAAAKGPFGTEDYRIVFEAVPLDVGHSFVHLGYAYSYGTLARLAMNAYLATLGRSKVGFTVVGHDGDGQPEYTGGMRGAVERNAMRYYLAVDADLAARTVPPDRRRELRSREWFAMTERYALQLHEVDEKDYLEMKRREAERERTGHE